MSVPVTRLAKWKTTAQLVAVGFLLAGEAGDAVVKALLVAVGFLHASEAGDAVVPVITSIGLTLLWVSAIVTLYTGYDYFRAGLRHVMDE